MISQEALYRYLMQILLAPPGTPTGSLCFSIKYGVVNELQYTTARPATAVTLWRPALFEKENKMLYYALVFLLIAIVAAVFGFGGVAIISAGIAKILFFVFIVLFLVSLITHMSRRV